MAVALFGFAGSNLFIRSRPAKIVKCAKVCYSVCSRVRDIAEDVAEL